MADESTTLTEEIAFYESEKESLLATHEGQYALISGRELLGVHTTEEAAYEAGLEKLGNKSFLIRRIRKEEPRLQAPVISVGMNLGSDSKQALHPGG